MIYKPHEAKAALARLDDAAHARPARLEVPLGELCKGLAPTLLILGPGKTNPDEIVSLTKEDQFNAQGLEGKAVVRRPLGQALAALSFLPEYRARVVVESERRPPTRLTRKRFKIRREQG